VTSAKETVQRFVDEAINAGDAQAIEELCTNELATNIRAWIKPFRDAFPDVHMRTIELIAEEDRVVGRFKCSATHAGEWRGRPPTGRRFEDVDEVYFFTLRHGRIADAWGLEDNLDRLRQLGLPAEP
jgi:predicted ester cyclase